MVVAFRELVCLASHVAHNAQTELLAFLRLSVVFAGECHKAFSQADESDSECALVDNALYGLVGFQLVASVP